MPATINSNRKRCSPKAGTPTSAKISGADHPPDNRQKAAVKPVVHHTHRAFQSLTVTPATRVFPTLEALRQAAKCPFFIDDSVMRKSVEAGFCFSQQNSCQSSWTSARRVRINQLVNPASSSNLSRNRIKLGDALFAISMCWVMVVAHFDFSSPTACPPLAASAGRPPG